MCEIRLKFIKTHKEDDEIASILAENYYEIIKELLVALLLRGGLKSDNHECLISYFKSKYSKYEYEVSVMYELKIIRNRIAYDGFFVGKEYISKNKLEFEHIAQLLKSLIEKDL